VRHDDGADRAVTKRLVYVHYGDLNSGQANVVHVARMADAFSSVVEHVSLVALVKGRFSTESFFERFGRRREYTLSPAPLRGMFSLNVLGLWLRTFLATRCGTSGIIYTRSAVMAVVLAVIPLPMILEIHSPFSSLRPRLRKALLFLVWHGRFRSVVVISARLKVLVEAELTAAGLRNLPAIIVAHDGANACAGAASVGKSGGRLAVGYAGHLYPGRGVDLIVECARACPDFDFEIVGGSTQSIEEWRQYASGTQNVTFSGRVPPVRVEKFLLGCDVLLAPYAAKVYTEGGAFETSEWMSPLKIFEYMAAGKAIVCSDIPVIREVLQDGVNCVLCEPGNVTAWVDALQCLASDSEFRDGLGERARNDLLASYTWDARAKAILHSSGLR
jgi:glycosyltransferase involved in cell wall biosynthesis